MYPNVENKMYKTILVEDESKNLKILKKLLSEHCPTIEVVAEALDANTAYDVIKNLKPDLVFLDIVMPYGTAFDLLDKLMPIDFEIIFITAYDNYSIKAFKYSAMDYLLKPFNIKELQDATQRAIQKISGKYVNQQLALLMSHVKSIKSDLNKIAIPTVDGFNFINVDEIIRCEANGPYTYIFTVQKDKIVASRNIKEFEDVLPKNIFFRVHNSHLVNLSRISKYSKGRGGTIFMEDGTKIEVASRRRNEFLGKFQ